MMFVVKKTFMASESFPCLQWEMASNQTETILGLDQSPGHLLDCSVLKGIGKAGVVKYYYSALYLESYIFQLFFFFSHTKSTYERNLPHLPFALRKKKRKDDYIYEGKDRQENSRTVFFHTSDNTLVS